MPDRDNVRALQVLGSCMHSGGGIVHDVIARYHIGVPKLHLSESVFVCVCICALVRPT